MPGHLSRRSLPAAALLVAAAVIAAAAIAPHRTLLAAPGPGPLPQQAASLRPVAALPAYRAPVRRHKAESPRHAERRERAVATPTPEPIAAPELTATPAARRVTVAPTYVAPVRTPAPAPTFDSSGTFDSSR